MADENVEVRTESDRAHRGNGIDVADSIMEQVNRVMQASTQRLDDIVARCHEMKVQIAAHATHVASVLEDRDQQTRDLLTRAGHFAQSVDEECKQAEASLAKIAEQYRI